MNNSDYRDMYVMDVTIFDKQSYTPIFQRKKVPCIKGFQQLKEFIDKKIQ